MTSVKKHWRKQALLESEKSTQTVVLRTMKHHLSSVAIKIVTMASLTSLRILWSRRKAQKGQAALPRSSIRWCLNLTSLSWSSRGRVEIIYQLVAWTRVRANIITTWASQRRSTNAMTAEVSFSEKNQDFRATLKKCRSITNNITLYGRYSDRLVKNVERSEGASDVKTD